MQALELGVWDMRPRLARVSQWPWACDLPSTSPSVFIGRRGIRAALAQRLLRQGTEGTQLWEDSITVSSHTSSGVTPQLPTQGSSAAPRLSR